MIDASPRIPLLEGRMAFMMLYDNSVRNRLKRVEGQIRGVLRMMESDQECKDIVTQLTAIRSAVDKTIGVIVSSNLVDCVMEVNNNGNNNDKSIEEAINLFIKSR